MSAGGWIRGNRWALALGLALFITITVVGARGLYTTLNTSEDPCAIGADYEDTTVSGQIHNSAGAVLHDASLQWTTRARTDPNGQLDAMGKRRTSTFAPIPMPMSTPTDSPTPTAPASTGLVAGLNDHPIWLCTATDTQFNYIADSHATAVRIDVPWEVMDGGSKGVYSSLRLGLIDAYVNRSVAAGIDVLMVVTNAPSWANGSSDPHVAPINNADFTDYLAFLINRYNGKVNAYEIWNEPNGGWAWTNPDAARYASLLKASYTRAKAINPNVQILAPSLSGPDQASWLNTFYAQGTKDYFDAFSMHGYWWNLNGSTVLPYYNSTNPNASIFGAFTTRILPVMKNYGDGAKRVWWTETGIATQGSSTTEADAAAKVDEAFNALKAGVIPTMDRVYWYSSTDTIGTGSEQNFGLIDLTGTTPTSPTPTNFIPKPAYTRFQNQAGTLD